MRIGVTVPLASGDLADGKVPTFEETLAYASRSEQLALDSIWVYDHLLFRYPPDQDEGLHEAWTTLTALAARVPRVELGTLVMCGTFRNPGLMAKMAATLDDLSGGRLVLGLGAGWHDPEYEAFGYPTDHRVSRFEEDLEVIARLLRGEHVTLEGAYRTFQDAVLAPPPGRRPPILVAAKGDRMMRLTARWADAFNTAWYGRVNDRLHARVDALDRACAEEGRDPSAIRRTVGIRLREAGEPGDDDGTIDTDAVGLARFFDELHALGFADAIVWSLSKSTGSLEKIAEARERHLARSGGR